MSGAQSVSFRFYTQILTIGNRNCTCASKSANLFLVRRDEDRAVSLHDRGGQGLESAAEVTEGHVVRVALAGETPHVISASDLGRRRVIFLKQVFWAGRANSLTVIADFCFVEHERTSSRPL